MSQQILDLRKAIEILRRHRLLVVIVAGLGLLAGAAYSEVFPPAVTSTAIVSLPQIASSASATQVVIADSDPVLSTAAAMVRPRVSLDKIRSEVQVKSLTSSLISITAKGKTAAEAEDTANAVARSYIHYVTAKKSPVGHVVATVFQLANTATVSSKLKALLITGLIGAFAGVVLGGVASIAIGRKDRRLRQRDEIANSIGIPVLASLPVGHPTDAAGWAKLVTEYRPRAVYGWQLRTAMDQLGITGQAQSRYGYDGPDGDGRGVSVAVVSLSSDPGAVALGPQLAAFAASQGIATALVVGPQEDTKATATLRAACAGTPSALSELPRFLRLVVSDDSAVDRQVRPPLSSWPGRRW
jgi:capsular polysaccharide biosynthesis protein